MQSSNPDNANPTIRSIASLPSRGRRSDTSLDDSPESKYDSLLLSRTTASDYGLPDVLAWSSDSDSDYDSTDHASPFPSLSSPSSSQYAADPIDALEIYTLTASISDPEHPHTLGQLSVINLPDIHVTSNHVLVEVTPTITHCSLATVIGLAVRVRLEQALPPAYRVDVRMKQGSHAQDDQVNRQLADKERVAAALENDSLRGMLDKMMETCTT
ncbi:hypothetical protein MCOR25_009642 [Pyricularia grisea]|uniref:MIP18 family-like domain-containing protein n=1 Tax=Pyricularia grisea TaxID=148305 RepID=A0A6P8BM02_PYRGI|nr:uncharacterized protein PgNI_00386 [Pyricularia grisea]KAI6351980.1 hypothetical protein MCOR25_009642 [Pyricularia grisea]TLD17734.1 hypothetical protein PgNI_00386 [Pyricularia grisea]